MGKNIRLQLLLLMTCLVITAGWLYLHEHDGLTREAKTPLIPTSANAGEKTDTAPDIERVLEDAVQAADHIIEGDRTRVIVFTEIAKNQNESGLRNAAEQTIQHAIQYATGVKGGQTISDMRLIAKTQAEMGDLVGARTTIQRMLQLANPKFYGDISGVVATQIELGDIKEALQTADTITKPDVKAMALSRIAGAQAQVGDFTGAFQTIGMIEDKYERATGFSQIAAIQASTGNIKAAIQTAETVKDIPYAKTMALQDIARAQAKVGDQATANTTIQEALQTARLLKPNEDLYYIFILPAIAQTQAEIGDIKGALQTVEMIKAEPQEETLGENSPIDRVFSASSAESFKRRAIEGIARVQAKAGDIKGALETAKVINNGMEKVSALLGIAEAQADAGDVKGAFQTIKEINADKSSVLEKIAIAQANAGDIPGALQTAETMNDSIGRVHRAHAFHAIALARVKTGEAKETLVWANGLRSPVEKAYALLGVAEGLLRLKPASSQAGNGESWSRYA